MLYLVLLAAGLVVGLFGGLILGACFAKQELLEARRLASATLTGPDSAWALGGPLDSGPAPSMNEGR